MLRVAQCTPHSRNKVLQEVENLLLGAICDDFRQAKADTSTRLRVPCTQAVL